MWEEKVIYREKDLLLSHFFQQKSDMDCHGIEPTFMLIRCLNCVLVVHCV